MPPYLGVSGLFTGPGVAMPGFSSASVSVHLTWAGHSAHLTLTAGETLGAIVFALAAVHFPVPGGGNEATYLLSLVPAGTSLPPWYL